MKGIPVHLAVSEEFDHGIRARLTDQYRRAGEFLRLGVPYADGYWTWNVAAGSDAWQDGTIPLRLRHTFIAELDFTSGSDAPQQSSSGVRLPISQVRELLVLAAGGVHAIAGLNALSSSKDEIVRRASIGAVARSSLEHSASAIWVLRGEGRDERLARALLLEITGIEQLIKYLGAARSTGEIGDLLTARDAYVKVAKEELGAVVDLERVPKLNGMQVPKKTELIEAVIGGNPYPELSSFAHPNPFHGSTLESTSGGRDGQFMTVGGSTIHTESRLVEPTLVAFAHALVLAARYLGFSEAVGIREWLESCVGIWNEWCDRNGCRE